MHEESEHRAQRYKCPCCGYYTLFNPPGTYALCPICFWEDDIIQLENPEYCGGANRVSLNQGRKNYQEFGACEKEMLPYVRKATRDDYR